MNTKQLQLESMTKSSLQKWISDKLHYLFTEKWQDLQARNTNFCLKCFGFTNTFNRRERALRYAEESLELMQAAGLTESDVEALKKHVYSREPGQIRKELGNAQLTLLALGTSYGIHVVDEGERDLRWAKNNISYIREKYLSKPAAIVAEPEHLDNEIQHAMGMSVLYAR